MYRPALIRLARELEPSVDLKILDQGTEGACTGFALAAVINSLNQKRNDGTEVSARMLYEMARVHDEWPGEDYDGSSLRGAIGGWKNMGVCGDELWPYEIKPEKNFLTIEAAKNARRNTVGAYYRLCPEISHFHTALNEVGVIAASARVHLGWENPGKDGRIRFRKGDEGGHAFAIVGYDEKGFWIQNSWGTDWGRDGLALWSYEDWIDNLMDAWVVRLALPTPQIFGKYPNATKDLGAEGLDVRTKGTTPRADIAGHFVHIDDGQYCRKGRYWSTPTDVEQTAKLVAESDDYPHFLVYAHGGLNSPKASAARIAALRDGFKRNGIYPYHIMYDTGLGEELKDVIVRKGKTSAQRVGGFSDHSDRFLEGLLRRPGTLVWDEMKRGAAAGFAKDGSGTDAIKRFLKHFRAAAKKGNRKQIHLVGHSTGAIVLSYLLFVLQRQDLTVASCSLMAPAARLDLYETNYLPLLEGKWKLKLDKFHIYNLVDALERDDTVTSLYRKSLLYLVSNSFERDKDGAPLLGMQKFQKAVKRAKGKPVIHLSDGVSGKITRSSRHGGFDNDVLTMNHILARILGKKPAKPFTTEELSRFG